MVVIVVMIMTVAMVDDGAAGVVAAAAVTAVGRGRARTYDDGDDCRGRRHRRRSAVVGR